MPSFFERPKIGKPLVAALAAVVVLAVLATAVVLAYRAGSDAADQGEAIESEPPDSSEQAEGLEGADQVYDPLVTVNGAEYDDELYIFRGYEHSYVGAVSAAVDWLTAGGSSLDPDYHERLGEELLVENDNQSPADWRTWPMDRREDLGISGSGEVPDGYGLNATAMAYRTRNESAERIEVMVLVRLTGSSPYGSTAVNTVLGMDLVWTGQDWADSGDGLALDLTGLKVDIGDETSDEARSLGWLPLTN